MRKPITIFGIFVVDLNFRSSKIPIPGETLMGHFYAGPGGKGSNQAIAAKRAGGEVNFIAKIGNDAYGQLCLERYQAEGISTDFFRQETTQPTGVAAILLEDQTGNNAVVVCPGVASDFSVAEILQYEAQIATSSYFLTQLETPQEATFKAIELAHQHHVPVIFNPAPAAHLPSSIYPMCDYFIPNEVEAAMLSGVAVKTLEDAESAADIFLERGVKNVLITFGEKGVVVKNQQFMEHVSATKLDAAVVDTTGAGDAFCGGLAAALQQGQALQEAVVYANTAAGISVTRHGTALSTPTQEEIERILASG